jgi:hypothetical protein
VPISRHNSIARDFPMDAATALFANEAFYLAFSHHDYDAMDRLWARLSPVVCIHPGWPALTERDSIMVSWKNILQNPVTGVVTPHHARALVYGRVATVVCYEEVQGDMLVATNTFLFESGQIRMVYHQASPCSDPPAPEAEKVQFVQ